MSHLHSRHLSIALVWENGHGRIAFDGVHIALRERPIIAGLAQIVEIQYAPNMGAHRIMTVGGDWRDISRAERQVIEGWLRRMAGGVRDSLKGWDGRTERRRAERRSV